MTRFVVDASVAVAWFLPEVNSRAARRLLDRGHELIAPELIFTEVSHALLKRLRCQEITAADAERSLVELSALVVLRPSAHLSLRALGIAVTHVRSAYDALYVAFALDAGRQLVTADRRLYNGLRHSLPDLVRWVEDVEQLR